MTGQGRFFEDFAKVASGAFNAAAGMRDELEGMARQRMERFIADMNFVPREEFEAVREMAATARAAQEALSARVEALEARLAVLEQAPAKRSPRAQAKPGSDEATPGDAPIAE